MKRKHQEEKRRKTKSWERKQDERDGLEKEDPGKTQKIGKHRKSNFLYSESMSAGQEFVNLMLAGKLDNGFSGLVDLSFWRKNWYRLNLMTPTDIVEMTEQHGGRKWIRESREVYVYVKIFRGSPKGASAVHIATIKLEQLFSRSNSISTDKNKMHSMDPRVTFAFDWTVTSVKFKATELEPVWQEVKIPLRFIRR